MKTYRELLAIPGVIRLLIVATFPRLAYSMVGLSIFFHVEAETGSVAVAGLAVGASSLTGALTAGPRGKIVDRYGQTLPLYVLVPMYTTSNILLGLFAHSPATAVALSLLNGACAPPINISIRPLWKDIVGDERVRSAYGLDSAHMNLVQLLGPVVATFIAVSLHSSLALYTVAGSMAIGGTLLALEPASRNWVPEPKPEGEVSLLQSPAMRLMALEGIAMGVASGFIYISIPALATLNGDRGAAGPIIAMMGVGSIVGTVWAGAKAKDIPPLKGLRISVLLYAIALIPLPWVPLGPWMALVLFIASVVVGPAHVFYLETVDLVRPRGTAVAALASLWMIEGTAAAFAQAIAGNLAEAVSPQFTMLIGSIVVFASPLIFSIGMRTVLRSAAA